MHSQSLQNNNYLGMGVGEYFAHISEAADDIASHKMAEIAFC